jgi:sulfite reductase (NADPH) flavoprotein alpha-component
VCGEKAPMSVNVESELLSIFEQHGELSAEDAKKYFEQLKEEGRYSKDVKRVKEVKLVKNVFNDLTV